MFWVGLLNICYSVHLVLVLFKFDYLPRIVNNIKEARKFKSCLKKLIGNRKIIQNSVTKCSTLLRARCWLVTGSIGQFWIIFHLCAIYPNRVVIGCSNIYLIFWRQKTSWIFIQIGQNSLKSMECINLRHLSVSQVFHFLAK